ncbi:Omp28-related outer membrane protein [Nonlabens sp.]|uniref:Omp28-related outer membrane protein n=1 Tax=Nonlabens sp. TaxID=1888209 RepID=UPI003F69EE27
MKTNYFFKIAALLLVVSTLSCSSRSSNIGVEGLTIEVSDNVIYDQSTVEFKVVNGGGDDVTDNATIFVDGVDIEGDSYLFTGIGARTITAETTLDQADPVIVEVIEPSYTTKMLIEDYTGAWCAWCPVVTKGIIDAHAVPVKGDHVIAVAIHNGDSMEFSLESQMRSQFDVTEFPTATLNRTPTFWIKNNVTLNMDIPQALAFLDPVQPVGLAINSSVNGDNVTADVKVGFDLNQEDLKLVVFLLENGHVEEQLDNTSYFGGPGLVPDFVHNEILRKSFTDVFGDVIPEQEQRAGNVYEVSLSVNEPGVNTTDWDIVAFVVDQAGEVVNVQKAKVGTDQDFD